MGYRQFWFDEEKFLGLDHIPSVELNEVTFHLAIKLITYNIISAFRANLGRPCVPLNAESIYDKFFNEQALVRLRDNQITITIFAHKHRELVESLYHNLNSKLEKKRINPTIPWLNNHTLHFEFK